MLAQAAQHDRSKGPAVALLALLAAAVYANALGNGFVWDDNTIVVGDPAIRSLSNLPSFFARSYWGEADPEFKLYRPLVQATLAMDWAVGGGSPIPFHATNLLLHALATVLVFLLFRELNPDPSWSFLAAALFAVHPVHTDAVDSIVQRAEVLAAIGVVGGMLAALRGRWALLALCAAVGLLSKETAAVLPLLLAAWHVLGDRSKRPRWPAYVISLGALAAYLVVRSRVLGTAMGTHAAFGDAPLSVRLLTMVYVFGDYVRLLIVPWPLCADYAVNVNPHVRVTEATDARFAGAAFALAALAILWCVAAARRWRGAFWGAWTVIALLPVSNVFLPIGAIEAERFLYLPSVGACAILAWIPGRPELRRVGLLLVGFFAVLTVLRNPAWREDVALLDARMADAPDNPWPYFYRATLHMNEGRTAEAEILLDRALVVMPEFEKARQLRVRLRSLRGDLFAVAEDLEFLSLAHPDWLRTATDLALCYATLGDRRRAQQVLERMERAGIPPDAALRDEVERLLRQVGR